jgi:acetyl-CoA C-acetyltransferase
VVRNVADPGAPVLTLGRRTAIGTAGHSLAAVDVVGLTAPVLAEVALLAAPLELPIDDLILGNCLGPGGNVARVSGLAAGLGPAVPGVTVDRQCGSGLDAVLQAASRVRAGDARLILAGGAESASTAPWRFWPPTGSQDTHSQDNGSQDTGSQDTDSRRTPEPVRYTRAPFAPPGFPDPDMGQAADALAAARGISRARQDDYAAHSHARTVEAQQAGVFKPEIVAVQDISLDARPRPGMTAARLARLRPSFGADGTATAGNSCGISDGAAVLAVTTAAAATAAGLDHLRIIATAIAAGDPALPGAAPAPAVRRLLDRHAATGRGLTLADIGAFEITEAFASVVLAVVDELGIDEDLVCTEGGAIGLGHPWGASGTILLLRLASRMLRPEGPQFGLAACAIGGGQGLAMLVERGTTGG